MLSMTLHRQEHMYMHAWGPPVKQQVQRKMMMDHSWLPNAVNTQTMLQYAPAAYMRQAPAAHAQP